MAPAANTAGGTLGSNETIRLAVKDKSASGHPQSLVTAVAASVAIARKLRM